MLIRCAYLNWCAVVAGMLISSQLCALGQITLARSPLAPASRVVQSGGGKEVVTAFRISGDHGLVAVYGLNIQTMGSGNWEQDLNSPGGVILALDAGDGIWGSDDYVLWQGDSISGVLQCNFGSTLFVPQNAAFDLWLIADLSAAAGSLLGDTFEAAIGAVSDVLVASGETVLLGNPAPAGASLTVAQFHVTRIEPLEGSAGTVLTIKGFGFALPFAVKIGDTLCGGTPYILSGGTIVSGLYSPIVVPDSSLPPQPLFISSGQVVDHPLPFTFKPLPPRINGKGTADGGGCSSRSPIGYGLALFGLVIGVLAWSRYGRLVRR